MKEDPCFDLVNQNYAFIIAFENAFCKDYATEKVFNGLQHVWPFILALHLFNMLPLF